LLAAHPIPDASSNSAAKHILDLVSHLKAEDLVICLLSGGGSALLSLPANGISMADKQRINQDLLRSGADIAEINCVRKHLSGIKGGRLAAACHPARVCTLAISDVPDDDPSVIASGPTSADSSTRDDAMAVLARYAIDIPENVARHLTSPLAETVKAADRRLETATLKIIASPASAHEAAHKAALTMGLYVESLGLLDGEARMLGARHARLARDKQKTMAARSAPALLLSGGETSVTVRGNGKGGRNSEYLLALAIGLQGQPGIYAIACDTDGIDGSGTNAGCIVRPDTLGRAAKLGIDPAVHLLDNNALEFFTALDDLVMTGPTRTNVNDFRAIYISPTQ
jgi:hydroxypyruvate reductase